MRWDRAKPTWGARIVAVAFIVSALLVVAPAHSKAQAAGGDTLSLAITNGSTFVYSQQPSPRFTVTLVLAQPFSENRYYTATVTMDSGESFGGTVSSESQDKLTYAFDVLTNGGSITGGNRTATATFMNPDTGITVTSNSVNFTITPGTLPNFTCSLQNLTGLANPGQSLTFNMAVSPPPTAPGDWQSSMYTIQFVGPTTITYPNLRPDSNGDVTVNAPTQIGVYGEPKCFFNGTADFGSAEASEDSISVTVSEKHALGSVQFYTNPTTPVVNQPISVYVVFHPASGLPAPTGYVSFGIVGASTGYIPLNSDGTLLVNLGPVPSDVGPSATWSVYYDGDPYYDVASVNFPLTNPAIPGGSGGGGGSGNGGGTGSFGSPQATPSAGPKATATATRLATPTVTTASPNAIHPAAIASGGNATALWLAGALGVLVVLGGAGGFFVWSRRRTALAAANAGVPFMSAPPPGQSPYDDRTFADDTTFPSREE